MRIPKVSTPKDIKDIQEWAARIAVIIAAITVLGILFAPLFIKPPPPNSKASIVQKKQPATPAPNAAGPKKHP